MEFSRPEYWSGWPFTSQGALPNPSLSHWEQILYQLKHKGSPRILEGVAYPFSSASSWLRNRTGVSCTAGRFFTNWAIRHYIRVIWLKYHSRDKLRNYGPQTKWAGKVKMWKVKWKYALSPATVKQAFFFSWNKKECNLGFCCAFVPFYCAILPAWNASCILSNWQTPRHPSSTSGDLTIFAKPSWIQQAEQVVLFCILSW